MNMNPRTTKLIKEYFEALVIAVLLAMFIRGFVVKAYKIPSGSMLQTLQIGDHLLVNKFLYGVRLPFTGTLVIPVSQPQFQDIIVFEYPVEPSKDFIKRIVGVPGDTIELRNKRLIRNGQPVEEPYARHTDPQATPGQRDNMAPFTVPADSYFVMGDNRDESYDSRFWGVVKADKIQGKAWAIYWSWEDLSHIRWQRIGNVVK